jgi:hypothetical protein
MALHAELAELRREKNELITERNAAQEKLVHNARCTYLTSA